MVNLLPHQQEAMNQTTSFLNIGVFHDMGLGKTYTGSEMMMRFGCDINLIVCQKSKIQDWLDHFRNVYGFTEVYDLTNAYDYEQFFLKIGVYSMIAVINYELVWRRKGLLKLKDFTLMLDESSLIQNMTSKRTKFIMKMQPEHVILLSGTPVGGKYENLLSQCRLLGWDISQKAYDNTYVNWTTIDAGGMKHKIVCKCEPYKNIERLKSKMREHGCVFLKTEDVINLPEQRFQTIMVKAPKEYWKFQKHGVVYIGGELKSYVDESGHDVDYHTGIELVGDTSLTKLLYSRQICSQYSKEKLEAVKDLIQSTNDRLIIFYNFNAELNALKKICQELGRPTSEVNGHRKDLTAYEKESDSITLCQFQSASKGLNLQKCNKIIYFSLTLSSEDFEQSKKRIHRIGQSNSCMYYLLISKGTVEEQILQTLEERKDFTDELFKERKN